MALRIQFATNSAISRSSNSQMFFRTGDLKNFGNFIRKHLWSLFLIKLQAFRPASAISRSSRSQMFFRIGALKNFAKFIEKHLRSLFLIKLQTFRPVTLLKETPILVFSCEICEVFKNTFLTKHFRWLLLYLNYIFID